MRLDIDNITYHYPNRSPILKNISLSINSGERVGLVAPSGYGKSTLSKIMAGFIPPSSGQVLIDGLKISKKGYSPVQLVYQHPEQALNPRLKLKKSLYEAWPVHDALLEQIGIEKAWLERYPHELSGGELQRFCIARALSPDTRFLIADEMTTMLDVVTQAQIWGFLLNYAQQRQLGLIVVTHNVALTEKVCTKVVYMADINSL